MQEQWLHNVHRQGFLPFLAETTAQELLHRLALQVTRGMPSPLPHVVEEAATEVVLEVEMDGVRYRLLRSGSTQPLPGLSRRETEIARLVAAGYPNKTIAQVLDISPWTVCTYLRRIFTKLGVSCRAAMVARLASDNMMSRDVPIFKAPGHALPAETMQSI